MMLCCPADGFWQSHPRSTQLLACIYKPACTRNPAANSQLLKFSKSWAVSHITQSDSSTAATLQEYQELQCAARYTGNLCGSCKRSDRVSQANSHQCKPCQFGRAASIAVFVLARLLDLSIVLLQVVVALKERQRRLQLASQDVPQICESPGNTSHTG
jgi:hypothetical protein